MRIGAILMIAAAAAIGIAIAGPMQASSWKNVEIGESCRR